MEDLRAGADDHTPRDPDVSIIVEWEHVSLGEAERPVAMLRQVVAQTAASDTRFEVIVAYDPEATDLGEMEKILRAGGLRDAPHVDVRLEGGPGLRYYELKNMASKGARGAIVVFMDSDVIPQEGWLEGILEPFEDPSVQVVSGNVYVGPITSAYDKAFALFWMFDLEHRGGPVRKDKGFHANNVAFRRETILAHPWRQDVELSPNKVLNDKMRELFAPVPFATKARALHPTPNSLSDMARYAFSHGYDRAFLRLGGPIRRLAWLVGSPLGFVRDLSRYLGLILPKGRRQAVGLRAYELPVALALAFFYGLLKWVGFVLTMIAPGFVPRRYSTGSSVAGSRLAQQPKPWASSGRPSAKV